MNRIYFDHNATSPLRPEVREYLEDFLSQPLANPSSIHGSGRKVRRAIDEAHEHAARLIGASPSEIIFTSGGTEANHLAWRYFQKEGVRAVTTSVEHSSVMGAAAQAEKAGAKVTFLPVTPEGELRTGDLLKASDESRFFSIQHANNETGVIAPIRAIAETVKKQDAYFHTDAVQTVGKMGVDVRALGVDYLAMSAHKLGALAGVGALYARKGAPLEPIWDGGTQEKGRRGGTENALGIAAMGIACKVLLENGEAEHRRVERLRDMFESEMLSRVPGCEVSGKSQPRLPNTSHISFEGVTGESLLMAGDLEGMDCSAGSACASGSLKPSHVLLAMGMTPEKAHGSVRFSFGWCTMEEEIGKAVELFPKLVARVRAVQ